jgi:hypothetical protein
MIRWLTLDSELVFVGDNGETEASDKSERKGVEASIFWQPQSWLIIDSDVALSQARLQPSGQLSGSVEVLNITNEEGNDITYLYDSRLPAVNGNPAEVTDVEYVHLHPIEPRMVRASLAYRF